MATECRVATTSLSTLDSQLGSFVSYYFADLAVACCILVEEAFEDITAITMRR